MTLGGVGNASIPNLPIPIHSLIGVEDPTGVAIGKIMRQGRQQPEETASIPKECQLKVFVRVLTFKRRKVKAINGQMMLQDLRLRKGSQRGPSR